MTKNNHCGIYKNNSIDEYECAKLVYKENLKNIKQTLITFKDLNGAPSYRNIVVSYDGKQFSRGKK